MKRLTEKQKHEILKKKHEAGEIWLKVFCKWVPQYEIDQYHICLSMGWFDHLLS